MNLQQWRMQIMQEPKVQEFWKRILGDELMRDLLDGHIPLPETNRDKNLTDEQCFIDEERYIYEKEWLTEECFYPFYQPFLGLAVHDMEKNCKLWCRHCVQVKESFIKALFRRLESVCIRVLIMEMSILKSKGNLSGADIYQEYDNYVQSYLVDFCYRKKIRNKYPVLLQCCMTLIHQFCNYTAEFCEHLNQDGEHLGQFFFGGQRLGLPQNIEMNLSDTHFQGKSVIRVYFQDGHSLIYKPRTGANDLIFQNIYQNVAQGCGMDIRLIQILDRGSYSWIEMLSYGECGDKCAVERYYKRLGILLMICWLFNVGDLHFENLIACGEYPVLIDLETFPGCLVLQKSEKIKDLVIRKIKTSVWATGILPVKVWRNHGGGIQIGALGKAGRQKLPVRVPCVIKPKTSEMKISTMNPELQMHDNLPYINGIPADPVNFSTCLIEGFDNAFNYIQEHLEIIKQFESRVFRLNSRCLLRHTQQYGLYQSSAFHPVLLSDVLYQQLFFVNLFNGIEKEEKWRDTIVSSEAQCLSAGDIPYFYGKGNECTLYDSMGNQYEDYFQISAREAYEQKLKGMNSDECGFQKKLICLSVELLSGDQKRYINSLHNRQMNIKSGDYPFVNLAGRADLQKNIFKEWENTAVQIGLQLLRQAVYTPNGKELLWPTLKYTGVDETDWIFTAQNMEIYDGLSGTSLLMAALAYCTKLDIFKNAFKTIQRQLYKHTEMLLDGKEHPGCTGIFTGEASLIYTYLAWYNLFHNPNDLYFAQKHSQVVEDTYEHDHQLDLLSGNAGAILAWIFLYEITGKASYMKLAERGAWFLCQHRFKMPVGTGICIPGEKLPLGGMSHGCSGFILALARLYKHTKKEQYARFIGDFG